MKNIIGILSIVLILMAAGCEYDPHAGFYASNNMVDVYETVYFTNTSSNADSYYWDFGDGTFSRIPNPSHIYEQPGRYLVTLEVMKGSGEIDRASMYIDVISTSLEIEVLEYIYRYPVPEASIMLYTTLYDWDHQTNPLFDGMEWMTDAYGMVLIHGLRPLVYYVDIWHPTHNNYLLAEEDINNVKTDPLIRGQVNAYTFYVDYVGSISRKDGKEIAQYKIVKIERKEPGRLAR